MLLNFNDKEQNAKRLFLLQTKKSITNLDLLMTSTKNNLAKILVNYHLNLLGFNIEDYIKENEVQYKNMLNNAVLYLEKSALR